MHLSIIKLSNLERSIAGESRTVGIILLKWLRSNKSLGSDIWSSTLFTNQIPGEMLCEKEDYNLQTLIPWTHFLFIEINSMFLRQKINWIYNKVISLGKLWTYFWKGVSVIQFRNNKYYFILMKEKKKCGHIWIWLVISVVLFSGSS